MPDASSLSSWVKVAAGTPLAGAVSFKSRRSGASDGLNGGASTVGPGR